MSRMPGRKPPPADELSWQDDGSCRNPSESARKVVGSVLFPKPGVDIEEHARRNKHAIADLCGECPVEADCLNYALKNNIQEDIWGGKTPKERKALLRRSRKSL